MGEHVLEDAVRQRMLAALGTVPGMRLDRLRRFVGPCFVVMPTSLTRTEPGCLAPSAKTAKRRSHRRVTREGVFDPLMERSQPVAAPDVLHTGCPAFH